MKNFRMNDISIKNVEYKIYTLIFMVYVFVAFAPFIFTGRSFIWYKDSYTQYYPAFLYIGKYLRSFMVGLLHGNWMLPTFDLSIGMGESVFGTLNYYGFGNPLNLFAIFANERNGAYIYSFMFLLRAYLGGICFIMYCRYMELGGDKNKILSALSVIAGALIFVFSGFGFYGCMKFPEWGMVLIYFPLMLLGVEKYRKEQKPLTFILAILLAALCGFYFLYMCSLGIAIYIMIREFFSSEKINIWKSIKICFMLGVFYGEGLLLSAPFLIPAIKAFFGSKRNSGDFTAMKYKQFYIPDYELLIEKLKEAIGVGGADATLAISIGCLVACIVIWFLKRNARRRQIKITLILAIIALATKITGYIFNAGVEPNDRWIFLFQMLLAIIVVEVLANISDMFNRDSLIWISRIFGVAIFVCQIFVTWHAYTTFLDGYNVGEQFVAYTDTEQISDINKVTRLVQSEPEAGVYRISKECNTISGLPDNYNMLYGIYGDSWYFSMVNEHSQELADRVTQDKILWRSYGQSSNDNLMALHGVKYSVSGGKVEPNEQFVGFSYFVGNNVDEHCETDLLFQFETNPLPNAGELVDYIKRTKKNCYWYICEEMYDNKASVYSCDVNCENDGYLIVTLPFNWNWKATIDGCESSIENRAIAFNGLWLQAGQHHIELSYHNPYNAYGLWLFGAGAVGLVIIMYVSRKLIDKK